MAEFPQFNNAKLMIAASVRHCRTTIEDLPLGHIVVDEEGAIKSIDIFTRRYIGLEKTEGKRLHDLIMPSDVLFPREFSAKAIGDLGDVRFVSSSGLEVSARVVCVPGAEPGTYLLSVAFG